MSEPLVVTISHKLGQREAVDRFKRGLARTRNDFSHIITIEDETWTDNRLNFRVRALGQSVAGIIDVLEDQVRLEVTLPWLLARLAGKFVPTLQNRGTLLLEKK